MWSVYDTGLMKKCIIEILAKQMHPYVNHYLATTISLRNY